MVAIGAIRDGAEGELFLGEILEAGRWWRLGIGSAPELRVNVACVGQAQGN